MLKDNNNINKPEILLRNDMPYKKMTIDENCDFNSIKKQAFNDMIANELQLSLLQQQSKGEIHVSTITLTCKISDSVSNNTNNNGKKTNSTVTFNCDNIAKYIDLDKNCIVSVQKDSGHVSANEQNTIIHRTVLTNEKKKRSLKAKKKRSFYNQVSMYVKISSKDKPVHVKLFTNGSFQIAGCKTSEDISNVIISVMKKLREVKAIIVNGKIEEKPFISNLNYADIAYITNLKVSMINTNFKIKFKINLAKLHSLLLLGGHKCLNEKHKHACANLTFHHPEKDISIFIFEKGAIVITGAQNGDQILSGYEFIKKFLYTNYKKIRSIDQPTNQN